MAAAAPEAAPTFNWTGMGQPEGTHIHYQSFNFAGQHYKLGDCVYLLPEEEGSPCYIARLVRAYEDTTAKEAERLVIEVQWFERRCSLPTSIASGMHDAEVVESDLVDTNLVGCLDSKALIVTANSFEEAAALVPPGHKGDWHFCRGVWDSEAQRFKSYAELGSLGCFSHGAAFGQGAGSVMYQQYQQAALNGYGESLEQDHVITDDTADLTPRAGGGRARGGRSRRASAARVSAVTAAAAGASNGGGYGRPGIPGKVCCECGATQTPQWREGPKGPKTLCNACGVRYQRQQSKAKSNKRSSTDRGGKERGSSPAPHGGGRGSKHARLSAASNTPDAAAAAAAAAAMEDTFAAAMDKHQLQQLQMAQLLGNGTTAVDPAAAAAVAAPPQHHHGTRRNAKHAAAAAAATTHGSSPRSPAGDKHQKGSNGHAVVEGSAANGKGAGKAGHEVKAGEGQVAGGTATGRIKGGHPALAAAVAAAGEQLGYYADAGSPPNSNTRILEYEDEDGQAHQQQQQRQSQHQGHHTNPQSHLSRSNTYEAADALQNLANGSQQQQQPNQTQQQQQLDQQQAAGQALHPQQQASQVHTAAATANGFFSTLGSPATALLITEQGMLQSDSMPLLSLDDKYRPGTPSGLGTTDALEGIHPHSLSPLKSHAQQLLAGSTGMAAATAAAAASGVLPVGRDGSMTSMPRYGGLSLSGPGAVCASPGRLISAMVQNLKLPAPLTLNPGLSPLPAVTTLGMPSVNLSQQQQHSNLLTELLAGPGNAPADGTGRQQQHLQLPPGQQALVLDAVTGCDSAESGLLMQLRSLLFRATAYAPDVHGLSGLYPGPSTPRSLQQVTDELESLPDSDKAQLQLATTAIEDCLSKAKAAEAAVLAVSQVLQAKRAAADEARAEVERSVVHLRTILSQISPAVAAAASGAGTFSSAAAAPGTSDQAVSAAASGASGGAAANGLAGMAGGTAGLISQGFVMTGGSGGMLGLAEDVGTQFDAALVNGPTSLTDTDDLLRDPDDPPVTQHQAVVKAEPEHAAAAAPDDGDDDVSHKVAKSSDHEVRQDAGETAAAPAKAAVLTAACTRATLSPECNQPAASEPSLPGVVAQAVANGAKQAAPSLVAAAALAQPATGPAGLPPSSQPAVIAPTSAAESAPVAA